jgi:hypothetical protein
MDFAAIRTTYDTDPTTGRPASAGDLKYIDKLLCYSMRRDRIAH